MTIILLLSKSSSIKPSWSWWSSDIIIADHVLHCRHDHDHDDHHHCRHDHIGNRCLLPHRLLSNVAPNNVRTLIFNIIIIKLIMTIIVNIIIVNIIIIKLIMTIDFHQDFCLSLQNCNSWLRISTPVLGFQDRSQACSNTKTAILQDPLMDQGTRKILPRNLKYPIMEFGTENMKTCQQTDCNSLQYQAKNDIILCWYKLSEATKLSWIIYFVAGPAGNSVSTLRLVGTSVIDESVVAALKLEFRQTLAVSSRQTDDNEWNRAKVRSFEFRHKTQPDWRLFRHKGPRYFDIPK